MKWSKLILGLGVLLVLNSLGFAEIPGLLNVQAILKDTTGNPVPDNTYAVTFFIYDALVGGNTL